MSTCGGFWEDLILLIKFNGNISWLKENLKCSKNILKVDISDSKKTSKEVPEMTF